MAVMLPKDEAPESEVLQASEAPDYTKVDKACTEHGFKAHHHSSHSGNFFVHKHRTGCPFTCEDTSYGSPTYYTVKASAGGLKAPAREDDLPLGEKELLGLLPSEYEEDAFLPPKKAPLETDPSLQALLKPLPEEELPSVEEVREKQAEVFARQYKYFRKRVKDLLEDQKHKRATSVTVIEQDKTAAALMAQEVKDKGYTVALSTSPAQESELIISW